jgi:BlaI family transcriptional regulator, penicillinase repressor
MEIIGGLEADVLEVLKERGEATAGDVHSELGRKRSIAYTTVSTTLDRLYRKKLVDRKALPGPGGTKYLFFVGKDERAKLEIVEEALDRLTQAFGDTAYSAIYKKLENIPDVKLWKLKKEVAAARRKGNT